MRDALVIRPTVPHRLWRASFLVAGVFAFLILSPKHARADGLLEPVTDAVDQTASVGEQTASTAVDDLASTATQAVDVTATATSAVGTVTEAADAATGTVSASTGAVVASVNEVVTAVDQPIQTVIDAVQPVLQQPVLQQAGAPQAPSPGGDTTVPNLPSTAVPAAPAEPALPAHHRAPTPTSKAVTSASAEMAFSGGSATVSSDTHKLPAAPARGAAGAATPAGGDSPRDPGGRGSSQLAAILVAALVLASASSRWLRLFAFARAPNPVIPILVSPG